MGEWERRMQELHGRRFWVAEEQTVFLVAWKASVTEVHKGDSSALQNILL